MKEVNTVRVSTYRVVTTKGSIEILENIVNIQYDEGIMIFFDTSRIKHIFSLINLVSAKEIIQK